MDLHKRARILHQFTFWDVLSSKTQTLIEALFITEMQNLQDEIDALRPVVRAALALNDGLEGENTLYGSLARNLADAIEGMPEDLNRKLRKE